MMKTVAIIVLLSLLSYVYAQQVCNDDQLDNVWHDSSVPRWASLTDERDFAKFRVQRLSSNLPANTAAGSGRGIAVIVSSSADVASAYVAVKKLRRITGLRIEVFHGHNTMNVEAVNEFQSLPDVKVVELQSFSESSRMAQAVLQSSYMDVLVIDARTMVLADPIGVFNQPQYRAKGLLMLPSLHKTSSANPIWHVMDMTCVDSYEQSAAVMVVNKAQAWNALQMAVQMKGHFFQSLTNGEQNIVRLAALATNTPFHMLNVQPNHIATQYRMFGENKMCAHLTTYRMDGITMFAVSANPTIEHSGTSFEQANCLNQVEATVNDDIVGSHASLFASLPDVISRAHTMAVCSAGVKSQTEAETLARTTFANYKVDVSDMALYATKYVTIPYSLLVPQCVSGWSCVSSTYWDDTVDTAFVNITTGLFMSARVSIETDGDKNKLNGVALGNCTYIFVGNTGLTRTGCDYAGIFDTTVTYNIATAGWAVIRVAWDAKRRYFNAPITLSVTYLGDSSAAFTSYTTVSPMVLAIVAIIVTIMNRFN